MKSEIVHVRLQRDLLMRAERLRKVLRSKGGYVDGPHVSCATVLRTALRLGLDRMERERIAG